MQMFFLDQDMFFSFHESFLIKSPEEEEQEQEGGNNVQSAFLLSFFFFLNDWIVQ